MSNEAELMRELHDLRLRLKDAEADKSALRNEYAELQASRDRTVELNCKQEAENAALLARLDQHVRRADNAEAYCRKMDGIIEEVGGVAVSCINPYEDLKRALLALKADLARAHEGLDERDQLREDNTVLRADKERLEAECKSLYHDKVALGVCYNRLEEVSETNAALRADIEWLAEQQRRERKSYSGASVEVTLIYHEEDGRVSFVEAPTFREAIAKARATFEKKQLAESVAWPLSRTFEEI